MSLSVMSRSRRRRSAWKHHPRHHQVAEQRRWVGAGDVISTCETHIITFLCTAKAGQAARRREGGCSTRKALPGKRRIELFDVCTSSSSCWLATLRVYHRRSERYMQAARHMTIAFFIFLSLFTIDTSGRAPGCCGGVLRQVLRRVGGPRGVHKLSRHTPQTRFFTFVQRSSVMKAVSLCFTIS